MKVVLAIALSLFGGMVHAADDKCDHQVVTYSETVDGKDRYGLKLAQNGQHITGPIFENSYDCFIDGLAAVKKDGKWGFVRKDGSFWIEPTYSEASYFTEGLAPVKTGLYWHFIDTTNTARCTNVNYIDLSHVSGGLATVKYLAQNDQIVSGFINSTCQPVGSLFEGTSSVHEGTAAVQKDRRWALYDIVSDKLLTAFQWDAQPYAAGHLWHVESASGVGARNLKGVEVLPETYKGFFASATDDAESTLVAVEKAERVYSFFDYATKSWGAGEFSLADPFSEGLAGVCINGTVDRKFERCGYIDRAGNWVIQPTFGLVFPFHDGRADISTIDSDGVIDGHYQINKKGEKIFGTDGH